MRRLLWLLLIALPACAQVSNPGVIYVVSAPSGSCSAAPPIQVVVSTGTAYTCDNGTWAAIAAGGGGDTITSPNSTLSVGGTSTATTIDFNLAHANTWTATQTFATLSATTINAGASPPTACGGASGCFALNDSSVAGTPTSGQSYFYVPTSTSLPTVSLNGGSEVALQTVSTTASCIAATTVTTPCLALQQTRTGLNATTSVSNTIYTTSAPANATYQICANIFISTSGTGTANLGAIWTTPGSVVESGYTFATANLSSTSNNWVGCFTTISKAATSLSYYLNVSGGSGSPVWEGDFVVTRLY
jgi:hypothetical protein